MSFARAIALWFLILVAPSGLAATDLIVESAFYRDPGGRATLEEVRQRTFTPYVGLLTEGYQRNAVYWLRLRIRAGETPGAPLVLRLRPHWHDDLQLFDPADPRAGARAVGDNHPWSANETPFISHTFLLPQTDYERDVYVRIQSVHSYLIDAQVLDFGVASRIEWRMQGLYFAFTLFVGMACLLAAVTWLVRPERVIGAFAVYLFAVLVYFFLVLGFGHFVLEGMLSGAMLDTLTTLSVLGASFLALVFHRLLIAEYAPSRLFARTLSVLACLPLFGMALFALGEPTLAVMLNSTGITLFSVSIFLTAWLGIPHTGAGRSALLPRRVIRGFYALFLLIVTFGATPLLGWLAASELTLHVFMINGAVTPVVMGALLHYRARRSAERQIEQLVEARQRAEQERRARVEQSQFVSMLNHELKTPLSVLKLLAASHPRPAVMTRNIDSMTALLDRCLISDRLEHAKSVQRVAFRPAQLVVAAIQESRQRDRFNLDCDDTLELVSDPELYDVLVTNLVDNAVKYAAQDSRIEVSLHREPHARGAGVCLTVRNVIGRAGVPDPERVFQKYYRSDSAKSVPGTGLGLYLVNSIAQLLGGDARCYIAGEWIGFSVCLGARPAA
jgi:signal transduction histidine kinase